MDRNVRALTVALLCVLAVSLGAATLADPQAPPGSGGGSGGQVGSGTSDDRAAEGDNRSTGLENDYIKDPEEMLQVGSICWPFFLSPAFAVGALVAIALLWWALAKTRDRMMATLLVGILVVMALPMWLGVTNCGTGEDKRVKGGVVPEIREGLQSPAAGGATETAAETVFSPPVLLVVVLVVAVVIALLVFRATGDDDAAPEDATAVDGGDEAADDAALAAVGEAAGEAADRLDEDADLENEVYRAWRDMTTHLNVGNPRSSTPAEFAAAAADAGMDETHVETLTELFRNVRYGGEPVTAGREERAVESLRAIESRYADGGEQ